MYPLTKLKNPLNKESFDKISNIFYMYPFMKLARHFTYLSISEIRNTFHTRFHWRNKKFLIVKNQFDKIGNIFLLRIHFQLTNNKAINKTSLRTVMVVIFCYFEREKDKISKFYINNSTYFEKSDKYHTLPTNMCHQKFFWNYIRLRGGY